MTTDTTHITKEALLQALNEWIQDTSFERRYRQRIVDTILARDAELSAQESKPVGLTELLEEAVGWIGQVACDGSTAGAAQYRVKDIIAQAYNAGKHDASPSVSAQDASPKDGWEITMTDDDPYPPIIKLRRPDGVGMVLTKGDFVYPYFAALCEKPK